MPAAKVTLNGVIYPKGRSGNDQPIPATFVGEAWLTDLGVGGGPVPPEAPVDPGYSPPWATPSPPGIWGPPGPWPTPPIYWPGWPAWPPTVPPSENLPHPGDPPVPLPPPAGSAGWPVTGIVPPPFIVVNYPGVGPIVVAPPASDATTPPA